MAHHLFHLPCRLEAISSRPSSSSSSVFQVFLLRVSREVRFPHATERRKHTAITLLVPSFLPSFLPSSRNRSTRHVRSFSRREDHSMVFPPNRSRLDRRLTSRKILRSALISHSSLSPLLSFALGEELIDRASLIACLRDKPFSRQEERDSYTNHVILSLMIADRSRDHRCVPLPRSFCKSTEELFELSLSTRKRRAFQREAGQGSRGSCFYWKCPAFADENSDAT